MALEENNIETEQEQEQQITESDILKKFIELQKNSVPLDKYNEKVKQCQDLMDCIVEGKTPDGIDEKIEVDLDEVRKNLFGKDLNNLEYAKNALALRDELIKRGEQDPFFFFFSNVVVTANDYVEAQKVADALAYCIEYADGDPQAFTNELMRLTKDNSPIALRTRR